MLRYTPPLNYKPLSTENSIQFYLASIFTETQLEPEVLTEHMLKCWRNSVWPDLCNVKIVEKMLLESFLYES